MEELGTVLALLHGAPDRVRRVRLEVVTRTDHSRTLEAFRRGADRGGGTVVMAFSDHDEPEQPGAQEDRARIWADVGAGLERVERSGTREQLGVRRGETWWQWDPDNGAMTNEEDEVGSSIAEELGWIAGGLWLVGSLKLDDLAPATVAGRRTWRLRATPRDDAEDIRGWSLHHLPAFGADGYELDVDADTGLILRVAGSLDGEVYSVSEVVDLDLDGDLPSELFVFESPDGSPVRSVEDEEHHHMHLNPRTLREIAGFPLFGPGRAGQGWDAMLGFAEGAAMIHLHAPDGLRSLAITQSRAGEEDDDLEHENPAPWRHDTIDGVEYEWREPNEDWQPASVRFQRDGTSVRIESTSLTATELLELARGMVPLGVGLDEPAHEG